MMGPAYALWWRAIADAIWSAGVRPEPWQERVIFQAMRTRGRLSLNFPRRTR